MVEYNNIGVWNITLYKTDDEGNVLTDKDGNTKLFTTDVCMSYITDRLEIDNLQELQE